MTDSKTYPSGLYNGLKNALFEALYAYAHKNPELNSIEVLAVFARLTGFMIGQFSAEEQLVFREMVDIEIKQGWDDGLMEKTKKHEQANQAPH